MPEQKIRIRTVPPRDDWEYRCHVVNVIDRHVLSDWTNKATAEAMLRYHERDDQDAWIERRRKAGPVERVTPDRENGSER